MSIDTLIPSSSSSSQTVTTKVVGQQQQPSHQQQEEASPGDTKNRRKAVRWASSSSSSASYGTQSEGTAGVSGATPAVSVSTMYKDTIHIFDMTQDEIDATWYSRQDYLSFREEIVFAIQVYRGLQRRRQGGDVLKSPPSLPRSQQHEYHEAEEDDAETKYFASSSTAFCARGIEHHLSPRIGLRKKRRTQNVVSFVLEEQFRQSTQDETGQDDDDSDSDYLHPYYDNHQDESNHDDEDDSNSSSSSYSSWNSRRRNDNTNDCIAVLCSDMSRRCLQEAQEQGIRDQIAAGIQVTSEDGDEAVKNRRHRRTRKLRVLTCTDGNKNITMPKETTSSRSSSNKGTTKVKSRNVGLGLSRWRDGSSIIGAGGGRLQR